MIFIKQTQYMPFNNSIIMPKIPQIVELMLSEKINTVFKEI